MRGRNSGGYAFLIELMVVILFFALSTSVIMTLFVKADARSDEAMRLSGAITAASSAAELVRVSDDPVTDFMGEYGAIAVDGGFEGWLDPSFIHTGLEKYIIRLDCTETDGFFDMKISLCDEVGTLIYELPCASYAGGKA